MQKKFFFGKFSSNKMIWEIFVKLNDAAMFWNFTKTIEYS